MLLRLVIGYHFLFEGIDKLLSPGWSSTEFLLQTNWLFSSFYHYLADNQSLLSIVNFLNIWGQILIGLSLIIGLYSTTAAIFGAIMIFIYYIAIPPFIESYIFVDKNLLELFAFIIIFLFPTSKIYGMDYLIQKFRNKSNG